MIDIALSAPLSPLAAMLTTGPAEATAPTPTASGGAAFATLLASATGTDTPPAMNVAPSPNMITALLATATGSDTPPAMNTAPSSNMITVLLASASGSDAPPAMNAAPSSNMITALLASTATTSVAPAAPITRTLPIARALPIPLMSNTAPVPADTIPVDVSAEAGAPTGEASDRDDDQEPTDTSSDPLADAIMSGATAVLALAPAIVAPTAPPPAPAPPVQAKAVSIAATAPKLLAVRASSADITPRPTAAPVAQAQALPKDAAGSAAQMSPIPDSSTDSQLKAAPYQAPDAETAPTAPTAPTTSDPLLKSVVASLSQRDPADSIADPAVQSAGDASPTEALPAKIDPRSAPKAAPVQSSQAAPIQPPVAGRTTSNRPDDGEKILSPDAGEARKRPESAAADPLTASPSQAFTPIAGPTHQRSAAPPAVSQSDAVVQQTLSIARDGAWLDRLARDIAGSAANGNDLHFKLNPENLGALSVSIRQSADGASIRLTADNETTRDILVDAQPTLVAEARAHGLKVSETQVDLSQNSSQGQDQARGQNQSQTQNPGANQDISRWAQGSGGQHAAQQNGQNRQSSPDHQPFVSNLGRKADGESETVNRDSDELYA